MYITPNSTIRLVSQCPLEKTHENTLYFVDKNAQEAYFQATLYGRLFTHQSYQRVNKNTIRIAANAESLYDYTYMTFRNINFGTKWFYAFIDSIEYINNVTAEITYTIDVMQTWMFDYWLMPCFVEREHSETDEIGDNIVEEGLATGEYVSDDMSFIDPEYFEGYSIYIWATFDRGYNPRGGEILNHGTIPTYSGLVPIEFPLTTQGILDAMAWLSNVDPLLLQGIVSMNIGPRLSQIGGNKIISIPRQSAGLRRADGFAPKNKKLYTYPYCGLQVSNNVGKNAIYRYEFFGYNSLPGYCQFNFYADQAPDPTSLLIPLDYKGVAENFDESIDLKGYPQVAYAVDSFKAWLAQSASSLGSTGLLTSGELLGASVGSAVEAIGAAGGLGLAVGGVMKLISQTVDGIKESFSAPISKGLQYASPLLSLDKLKFSFMHKHITPEYVSIIDDYFSMFGYACKKLKRPNISSRPEWNYVKTIGCEIEGGVPADAAKEIQDIYDKGIRFWKWPEHYLHYEYDNSPVTVGGD